MCFSHKIAVELAILLTGVVQLNLESLMNHDNRPEMHKQFVFLILDIRTDTTDIVHNQQLDITGIHITRFQHLPESHIAQLFITWFGRDTILPCFILRLTIIIVVGNVGGG